MRALRAAWITLAVAAAIALTVAGCGQTGNVAGTTAPAAALTAGPITAPPTTPPPAPVTAETVLTKLTAAGLPITNGVAQNETTDPNNLLGRPNQYVSRASFDLPEGDKTADPYKVDRGGVIEVFADAALAQTRSAYIQDTLKAIGPMMGTEYHYLSGPVLVRIWGAVKPSVATTFETAVKAL